MNEVEVLGEEKECLEDKKPVLIRKNEQGVYLNEEGEHLVPLKEIADILGSNIYYTDDRKTATEKHEFIPGLKFPIGIGDDVPKGTIIYDSLDKHKRLSSYNDVKGLVYKAMAMPINKTEGITFMFDVTREKNIESIVEGTLERAGDMQDAVERMSYSLQEVNAMLSDFNKKFDDEMEYVKSIQDVSDDAGGLSLNLQISASKISNSYEGKAISVLADRFSEMNNQINQASHNVSDTLNHLKEKSMRVRDNHTEVASSVEEITSSLEQSVANLENIYNKHLGLSKEVAEEEEAFSDPESPEFGYVDESGNHLVSIDNLAKVLKANVYYSGERKTLTEKREYMENLKFPINNGDPIPKGTVIYDALHENKKLSRYNQTKDLTYKATASPMGEHEIITFMFDVAREKEIESIVEETMAYSEEINEAVDQMNRSLKTVNSLFYEFNKSFEDERPVINSISNISSNTNYLGINLKICSRRIDEDLERQSVENMADNFGNLNDRIAKISKDMTKGFGDLISQSKKIEDYHMKVSESVIYVSSSLQEAASSLQNISQKHLYS